MSLSSNTESRSILKETTESSHLNYVFKYINDKRMNFNYTKFIIMYVD